jgi:predicted TIM-barrel fold metal-dependent hydrolase
MMAATPAIAEVRPDPELRAYIEGIKAIDNHAHALPARTPRPEEAERPAPLGKTMLPYPVRLRLDNPEYAESWRALYGYEHPDMADEHARDALRTKLRLMAEKGDAWPSWVLDQAGIEVMLVNMPSLGPGQNAPRFRWVAHADAMLYPLAGGNVPFTPIQGDPPRAAPPTSVDAYLAEVVKPTLARWKGEGAVAIKFAIAYARRLEFAAVPVDQAREAYARGLASGEARPSPADTKALQDFLFREIAREAGTQGLVVHIHTGIGADVRFNIGGSQPLLLESVFDDPGLSHTRFVMVHGGWPFERTVGVMLIKPNVYADFSAQTFLRSTQALSETLEDWLQFYPERVLFGTDAYPEDTPLANWEEKAWLTTRTSREALALALSRMMADGRITRARAEALARMVLRENAMALYRFDAR